MIVRSRKRTAEPSPAPVSAPPVEGPALRVNAFRIGLIGGLGVLVALLIGSTISSLVTVLVYVGLALFLALGLDPLVSWIEQKLPRPAAIAIVFGSVVLVFTGFLVTVIPVVVQQTARLVQDFPKIVDDFLASDLVIWLQGLLGSSIDIDDAVQQGLAFLQDGDTLLNIGSGIVAVGAGVAGGLTGAVIVLILTLYFLASLRAIKRVATRFVPAYRRPQFVAISEEITGAVGRYVVGQVSLALINGVLSLILLTIIGAPLPVLLAFVAFVASLIPLVGTLSGAVIISVICLFASPLTALVAAIYYAVYMQVEAYVLSPRIMNRAVSVPGAIVVIAAVAGGAIGGVLGALVAIPVAASALIIVQKVVFPRQDAQVAPS